MYHVLELSNLSPDFNQDVLRRDIENRIPGHETALQVTYGNLVSKKEEEEFNSNNNTDAYVFYLLFRSAESMRKYHEAYLAES